MKEYRLLIGLGALLVLILIVGGIGWRAKWFEVRFNNERVEHTETTQEKGLSEGLVEDLGEYHLCQIPSCVASPTISLYGM